MTASGSPEANSSTTGDDRVGGDVLAEGVSSCRDGMSNDPVMDFKVSAVGNGREFREIGTSDHLTSAASASYDNVVSKADVHQLCAGSQAAGRGKRFGVYSWSPYASGASRCMTGRSVGDSLSEQLDNCLQRSNVADRQLFFASGGECDAILKDVEISETPSSARHRAIGEFSHDPPMPERDGSPSKELLTSTPMRGGVVRRWEEAEVDEIHGAPSQTGMKDAGRASAADGYETTHGSAAGKAVVSDNNRRRELGEEFVAKPKDIRCVDESRPDRSQKPFVSLTNTPASRKFLVNTIRRAPGNETNPKYLGSNAYSGAGVPVDGSKNTPTAVRHKLESRVVDESSAEKSECVVVVEKTTIATASTMSRKSKSLGNIVDDEVPDRPTWLVSGAAAEQRQRRKKDTVGLLRDKMKHFKKFFSRRSDSSSGHGTVDDTSCEKLREELLLHLNGNSNGEGKRYDYWSKSQKRRNIYSSQGQTGVGHVRTLQASMDSGFDQRCCSTDPDFQSSTSENKDDTPCIVHHQPEISPNEVIYESIPSCGSDRKVLSVDNILERCKSFEDLSSDEGSHLGVGVTGRADLQFISKEDLHSSGPYLTFSPREKRSSCDNLQIRRSRSKSWHDIRNLPSAYARREDRNGDSDNESAYYGVPSRMSLLSTDEAFSPHSSQRKNVAGKRRYGRSVSAELLPSGGARRCSQRRMAINKQPSLDYLSPDSADRGQSKHVSMAASAAYIPGVSLSDKLRLAASKGQVDKVRELLNAGATFEPDREGRTALHYAALNGQSEIVQILADEGADINEQDALGYTALHRAAAQGHLEVIKVLLVEGCLVDVQDEVHGNSSLHEAAWNGYSKTLELLIRHKANVHCINKAGFTALHLAAQNGHNQSARVLLYAGCNPDMKNNYGDTALHTAARYGHAGVTRILISARCHISEQNKNGDTALHIAAALKRRKLTKLLVEAGIKTTIKNKQNETAVDVARRKEHPEIIVIITTQLKNAKKSKKNKDRDKDKNKKEKGSKLALNGEETTEKKGLFFKKKCKTKAPDNTKQKVAETGVRVTDHPLRAPSEISSSEYNSQMAPDELLRGFRQHQAAHNDKCPVNRGASTHGTSTRAPKPKVRGLLTEYVPKPGVQYYRDLAGNIRQGPIGYAPVCNCQPALKKLEKQMEVDRNNLYDHIDTSHKTLAERIETLDKRTAQQIYSLDKLTKDRLEAERQNREEYVHSCLRKERLEMQENCEHKHAEMKHELKGYLDNRFTNFEQYYSVVANRQDPCYWCYGNEHHHRPRYHDDDMLNQNNMVYDPTEPPMPGRLYKSKSDETLSVASSHPSRRHWKLRSNNAEDVTNMKLAYANNRAQRQERKMRSKSTGVSARASSIEHLPRCRDGSLPSQRPLHIPEGNSGSNLHSEYKTYREYVAKQHQWKLKRNPVGAGVQEQFSQPEQHYPTKYNSLERGSSQQVKVEVHQAERPGSTSNGAAWSQKDRPAYGSFGNSKKEISGAELSRVRPSSDYTRTRSSSASRAPDGSSCGQSLSQGQPLQRGLPQSQSTYSMATSGQNRQGLPHSASYDSSSAVHQRSQQQHQRYAEHAASHVVNTQGRAGPKPPNRTSSELTSQYAHPQQIVPQSLATTPSSTSLRWNPAPSSSPDTPLGMYSSPNNSDSLISSQKSSPLYPSPNCPKGTRSESSSNPDSGYGSRLLGGRQVSGPTLPGSTSSSFQSHEHNSSLSTNHSSLNEMSPLAAYDKDVVRQQVVTGDGLQANGSCFAKMSTPQQQQQQQLQPQQQHRQQYPLHQQQYPQQPQQFSQNQQCQQYGRPQPPRQHQQLPPHCRSVPQPQSLNFEPRQQGRQQQYQGIPSRWHDAQTSNLQHVSNANTRMWPPAHTSWSSGITDGQKEPTQSENNNQAGIIGKATQV